MELKTMFPNISGNWIRWSDYEIKNVNNVDYIVPASSSTALHYSCTDAPEEMVIDALNLGKLVFEEKETADVCLTFARKYGPLGVVPETKSPLLDPGPYADNSEKGAAPNYNGIFTQKYGDPVDSYLNTLRLLYEHFLAAKSDSGIAAPGVLEAWDENPVSCGMSYRLTAGEHSQLIWQPDSLLAVLKLAYALAITDPNSPLKICKNCGEAYCNTHARSEFCSTKCRNYYNVKAFRERNK